MATETKEAEVKQPELSEREKIIAQMQTATPPVEEKTEQPPVEAEKKEEVKEEAKEVKQPEAPDWKAATYEERQKRKAEKELREKAEREAESLRAKIKQFESQKTDHAEEPITDYDRAILDLRKENQEMKHELRAIKETEAERTERERREALERVEKQTRESLTQVHKDLVSEGYPGFKFAVGEIQNELRRLVAEDEANISLDNPAGWKKIYKEKIFPDLQAEWQETEQRRSQDAKTELKKQANLSSSTGKMPPKPKSKEPDNPAEAYEQAIAAIRKSRGVI
jgi:hypothetical protein